MIRVINRGLGVWITLALLLLEGQAWALQQGDTAPFFSAVTSFESNERVFEAEFRNGMKVLVEEAYNVPLATIDAIVKVAETGSKVTMNAREAGALLDEAKLGILPLGGQVSLKWVEGLPTLRILIPADSTDEAIKALSDLPFPGPGPGDSRENLPDSTGRIALSDLDMAGVIALSLEEKKPPDSSTDSPTPETEEDSGDPEAGAAFSGLVVVGAVRHELVLNSIAEHFPGERKVTPLDLDTGQADFLIEPAAGLAQADYQVFDSPLEFPVFSISIPVPSRDHPRRPEAEILREIAGGGLASLFRTEDGELAVNLQHRADIVDRETGSYLVITAAAHPEFLDRAELHILASLLHLGRSEIPASLLTRGKALFSTRFLQTFDSVATRADFWTSAMARGGSMERSGILEALEQISPASFKKVMEGWLVPGRFKISEFIPAGSDRNFTSESYNETLDILLPQALTVVEKRLERLSYVEPEIRFSVPGKTATSVPPALKKSSVLRGPDIYIYELHNSPLVRIGVFYPGGFREENKANRGLTAILDSSMLQFWSRNGFDPEIISMEGKGGIIEGLVRSDYFGFRATVPASNFEPFFGELVGLIKRFPVKDEMYARYRNSRKYADFLENSASVSVRTAEEILPAAPEIGYRTAQETSGTEGKASSLTEWFKAKVNKLHPEIVIYGSVKGTSFMRGMVSLLSDSKLSKERKPSRRNRNVTRIDPLGFSDRESGTCTVVTSGLPSNSGREESLAVISRSFDGSDTEINWVILARKGYGIIRTGLGEENADNACAPQKIVTELKNRKFTQREFNQAKVRAISSHYMETENPSETIDAIALRVLSGERDDFIRQRLIDLKRVRVLEVESVMESLFGD